MENQYLGVTQTSFGCNRKDREMRLIEGIAGCQSSVGSEEFETGNETCVRVVDAADNRIVLRIGTHPTGVRMTIEEAERLIGFIRTAVDRAETRAQPTKT